MRINANLIVVFNKLEIRSIERSSVRKKFFFYTSEISVIFIRSVDRLGTSYNGDLD